MLTTIHKQISESFELNGDLWENVIYSTLPEEERHREFENDYGCSGFEHNFIIYTRKRVYWPHDYDGMISIMSVNRHPPRKR